MIERNINKRWEEGLPHHSASLEIIKGIGSIDFVYNNDSLCLKWGGDGDNGEHLMYLLDIYFECKEKQEKIC